MIGVEDGNDGEDGHAAIVQLHEVTDLEHRRSLLAPFTRAAGNTHMGERGDYLLRRASTAHERAGPVMLSPGTVVGRV